MSTTTKLNIKSCPDPGNGVHRWLYYAACCALDAGLTNEEAIEEIELLMSRDPASATEIEDALQSARGERRPSPRWSPVNQLNVADISNEGPALLELVSRSPFPIQFGEQSRSEEVVDALFPGNPWLCIGRSDRNFYTERRELWRGKLEGRSLIVPSSMSSQRGRTRLGKLSFHSQANTGPRRFLVVEFDRGTLDQQAALIWHLEKFATLTLVVFSGSKSLHSWFFCASQSEDSIRKFFDYAVSLGADPRMWTPSQFARLPDGHRPDGKTGEALKNAGIGNVPAARQALLYFNPGVVR